MCRRLQWRRSDSCIGIVGVECECLRSFTRRLTQAVECFDLLHPLKQLCDDVSLCGLGVVFVCREGIPHSREGGCTAQERLSDNLKVWEERHITRKAARCVDGFAL